MSEHVADPGQLPRPASMRRLVTGHTPSGESVVIFDDVVPVAPAGPHLPSVEVARLWMTDTSPSNNSDQRTDMRLRKFDERFGLVVTSGTNCATTEMGPGGRAPMHRTNSIDYNILISGQLTHILSSGIEHTFTEPGSIVIQRGTSHAWENRSKTEWCKWVTVLVDAEPLKLGPEGTALEENFAKP